MSDKGKQVLFRKPERIAADKDAWVASRGEKPTQEPMKRLTLDIPEHLHQSIKMECAKNKVTMADALRDLLMEKFAKE
ncbi:MAG: hypothetical protein ACRC9H_15215 [Aeromonas veronii]